MSGNFTVIGDKKHAAQVAADAVLGMCDWSATEEGDIYWKQVYTRLCRIAMENRRPGEVAVEATKTSAKK